MVERRGQKHKKKVHAKASSLRRKNKIKGVEDWVESWLEDKEEVENRFCEYFQDLFTTSRPSKDHINVAIQ